MLGSIDSEPDSSVTIDAGTGNDVGLYVYEASLRLFSFFRNGQSDTPCKVLRRNPPSSLTQEYSSAAATGKCSTGEAHDLARKMIRLSSAGLRPSHQGFDTAVAPCE
jgi:hypothetical protein